MLGNRNEVASLQSDFYRDRYRSLLRSLLVSLSFLVILIFAIIYLVLFKAPPRYYGTTTEGQIIPLILMKNGS